MAIYARYACMQLENVDWGLPIESASPFGCWNSKVMVIHPDAICIDLIDSVGQTAAR